MDDLLIRRRELLDLAGAGRAAAIHPRARQAAIEALAHPMATLRLFVERASGPELARTTWEGWLDAATVVLHESVEGQGPARTVVAPSSWLPSAIATITGLGVRAVSGGARAVVPRRELRAALDNGDQIDGFGAVRGLWTIEWQTDSSASSGMTILDQGPGDRLWRMDGQMSSGELHVTEIGATATWCQLARIKDAAASQRAAASQP